MKLNSSIQIILKTTRFLWIGLILLLAALVLSKGEYSGVESKRTIAQVSRKAHKVLNSLNEDINLIQGILMNSDFDDLMSEYDNYIEKLTQETRYSIYIFQDDSLLLWTDNSIPVSTNYSDNSFKDGLTFISNTWGICQQKNTKNYKVVGIAYLQRAYPYENRSLSNNFLLGSGVKSALIVTGHEGPNSIEIRDSEGHRLFNLLPPDSDEMTSGKEFVIIGLLILLVLSVLLLVQDMFIYGSKRWKSNWWLLALVADLFLIRWLMIKFNLPGPLYSTPFFDQIHGGSFFFNSLGDIITTGIFIFIWALNFHNHFTLFPNRISDRNDVVNPRLIDSYTIIGWMMVLLAFFGMSWLFEMILSGRENLMEVHKVLNLRSSNLSDLAFFITVLAGFSLFARAIVSQLVRNYSPLRLFLIMLVSLLLVLVFSRLFNFVPRPLGLGLFLIFIAIISVSAYKGQIRLNHPSSVVLIIIGSIFLIQLFYVTNQTKDGLIKSQLLNNLTNEHDQIAEMLFDVMDKEIKEDDVLRRMVLDLNVPEDSIGSYLQSNYFELYWNKYSFSANLCDSINKVSIITENRDEPCLNFFETPITQVGRNIIGTNFYYLDNFDGYINYRAKYPFYTEDSSYVWHLFLSLNSKSLPRELGYPDLLISGETSRRDSLIQGYSYAKYQDGKLVSKAGEYVYSTTCGNYPQEVGRIVAFQENRYDHHSFMLNSNQTILLSSPKYRLWDHILSFSYVFVLLYIIWLILSSLYHFPFNVTRPENGIKQRIEIIMVGVLLVSFILIGGGMIYYIVAQHDRASKSTIAEKTQSVLIELKHKLNEEVVLSDDWRSDTYPTLGDLLVKFSFVFNSDINLYHPDGGILATSRPEVFNKQLIGRKMNPYAYHELSVHDRMEFVHFENIGEMGYWSAYVPFYNIDNNLIAYLNLPYFAKQSVIRQEISTFIVAVLNAYFLLIFVAVLFAVFLSNQVTRPLSLLQEKFARMELGGLNQKVDYQKKDEIGSLVKSYNRMVDELEVSADKLARSERETAWREMARQIAHEIKNPLTPMKLSVQHLQRAWNDKAENWESYFKRVSQTLVEQINSLSSIADEFAQFARMPQSRLRVVDIVQRVKKSADLFEFTEAGKIELVGQIEAPIPVYLDEEQIQQVFNNLLKNAFQAIPKSRKPKVLIKLWIEGSDVFISFKDNGSGIDKEISEKLFQPNFTTKTSGMGLGLAISKGIIDSLGGKIWYETVEGEGSSFFISLPVYQD